MVNISGVEVVYTMSSKYIHHYCNELNMPCSIPLSLSFVYLSDTSAQLAIADLM